MENSTKLKEALKLSFAFALVYGIALKLNWLSPSWAGWSVVAIAALPGGQSLQKGLLRIWGTILASIIGITIISSGAQERWVFMILTAAWLAFSTYKMLSNKKLSYFWFVAGYVTLVITAAGPSSAGGFYIAVFRTLETILGIVVYTLVAVFIWPLSNLGSIKKTLNALLDTQTELLKGAFNLLSGTNNSENIRKLLQAQVKQMGDFSQSLTNEGVENYEVQEQKPLWNQMENLNNQLLKSFDRLFGGIEDLLKVNGLIDKPEIGIFFNELDKRFAEISNLLSGKQPSAVVKNLTVSIDYFNRKNLSHFDNAALAIIINELNKIETLSRTMVDVALEIGGFNNVQQKAETGINKNNEAEGFIKVLDIEYLKASFFVAAAIIVGFLIWFYINPPGHSSWYIFGGVFALIFAGMPQIKTIKLVIPFLMAMFLVSLIYVFVLPTFTGFFQLGLLLFVCMFAVQYFLSGPATLVFTIMLLQLLVVNNPQTFDGSALVNSFVFVPLFFIFLFCMSYIVGSPRPEKALLKLVSRFFKSAQYLITFQSVDTKATSYIQRYKTSFYLYELKTLPAKIKVWGKAIDKGLFSNTDFQQIEELTNSLEVFIVRMEILLEAKNNLQESDITEFNEILSDWRKRLERTFDSWDNIPEEEVKSNSSGLVQSRLNLMEEKLQTIIMKKEDVINKDEAIQFYHLLGGYRGVTEATVSFVKVADKLDWKQWKEERFQ